MPNSISKWFSPSARPQSDSSSSFNGRVNLNMTASTSRRRRHCEIDYDEEDNDEDNENVHQNNDKEVGNVEEGNGENYDDVMEQEAPAAEDGQEFDDVDEEEIEDDFASSAQQLAQRQRQRKRIGCVQDTEETGDNDGFEDNGNFSRLEMEPSICTQGTNLMRTSTRCVPSEKQILSRNSNKISGNNHHRQEHQNQQQLKQQPPAKRLRLNTSVSNSINIIFFFLI